MRKAILTAGLLLVIALAGCTGEAEGGEDDADDGEGRRSDGGRTSDGGNGTDPPHDDVTLLDTAVDLVGPQTATFDVQVPDNVTAVDFRIASGGATGVSSFVGLRIELSGCGIYDQGTGSSSSGTVALAGRLCKDASGGAQTLTVYNNGFAQANLRITGQVPKPADNSTTTPSAAP